MKVRIDIQSNLEEDEVVIRCASINETVLQIQNLISNFGTDAKSLTLLKGDTEYFIPQEQILFFETESKMVIAHTAEKMYETQYKLYELEENTYIADTPGFSALDLKDMNKEQLRDTFIEFRDYECKFRDCMHHKEKDCGVKNALEDKMILQSRYNNYLLFLEGTGKFKNINLLKYENNLKKDNFYLMEVGSEQKSDKSIFSIISSYGKVLNYENN